ncbi:hypothetical protein V1477_015110 [Vespula maculifrons]|uniref:Uncharacterized protein n=1 Tax=Vespula maculifrons TaxID=7453 RepID=A0ABD2BJV7_VESMC
MFTCHVDSNEFNFEKIVIENCHDHTLDNIMALELKESDIKLKASRIIIVAPIKGRGPRVPRRNEKFLGDITKTILCYIHQQDLCLTNLLLNPIVEVQRTIYIRVD